MRRWRGSAARRGTPGGRSCSIRLTGEAIAWEAQPPEDFQSLLAALRAHRERATDGHG
ncbi:MAG: hypothetical protein U5L11_01405 [Arhodomonas sp.]|nr:hypothetical protein [Arhodomonas sp.]